MRDCVQEDARSMSLASGRYMETVGFLSVSGLEDDPVKPLRFARRYLDQNRNTYAYHAGADFDTPQGRDITAELGRVAKSFNITTVFGHAPQTYWQSRYPPSSPHSLLNLLTAEVLPTIVHRTDRAHKPYTILNTGSIRFDVFKGPFSRNTQWIIMPFANEFVFLPKVDRRVAARLLDYLNLVGEHGALPSVTATAQDEQALDTSIVERSYQQSLRRSAQDYFSVAGDEKHSLGYVTQDLCDGLGDDVLHRPMPSAEQPVFVATELPGEEEEAVDVVFFDFLIVRPFPCFTVSEQRS